MDQQSDHLKSLADIKVMMERSTRFVSLSGFSGICIGLVALAGAVFAYLRTNSLSLGIAGYEHTGSLFQYSEFRYLMAVALGTLLLSLFFGYYFTNRRARKEQQPVWNGAARRLTANLLIPLVAGGLFTLLLMVQGALEMVVPSLLVFYGLALINGSKYTLEDVRYLGLMEVGIGLVAGFVASHGILFWAIGFGLLHIIYGVWMYWKYER
ncbi:MAG: hypothetical protein WD077_12455 [Bacteroidia bacterium]